MILSFCFNLFITVSRSPLLFNFMFTSTTAFFVLGSILPFIASMVKFIVAHIAETAASTSPCDSPSTFMLVLKPFSTSPDQETSISLSGSIPFMFGQSARCMVTPLPLETNPTISSPGTGLQHPAYLTSMSVIPLTIMPEEVEDLLFANKIVKHSKSNAIVLAKGKQLYASGVGQTSRVDSLRHAIEKAKSFDFDLKGCVMASDAFFPFPDCVEIAHKEGIDTVIQPGGSVRDNQTIDYCNENGVAMVTTGIRHFKH